MKDEDIKKTLEKYEVVCDEECACNFGDKCGKEIMLNALALINRQHDEIEKFKRAIKEADQYFRSGAFYQGMSIIAALVIELEKGSAEE